MSEDNKFNEEEYTINVKEHVTSTEEYNKLLESTPEEYKEDFKKALDYYSSQWQGIVDVLTKASNNKEVREGFMKELNKRMGQNKPTDT